MYDSMAILGIWGHDVGERGGPIALEAERTQHLLVAGFKILHIVSSTGRR